MTEPVDLSPVQSGLLASNEQAISVGMLERSLLTAWPASDACSWDKTGMLVGNPSDNVLGVCIALDPTISALEATRSAGANVLLTHHPVFLDAPDSFLPVSYCGQTPGSIIRCAIEWGISILSFHTALDVSVEGLNALPNKLRFSGNQVLDPLTSDSNKGFGCVCYVADDEGSALSLRHLSARCVSVLESIPRVWGNPDNQISSIVFCGGAASSLLPACLSAHIDCLVCGEVKYHSALDAASSGLSIIELGHDVSEFPLCSLLATEVLHAGVPEKSITMINQSHKWYTPEAIRR